MTTSWKGHRASKSHMFLGAAICALGVSGCTLTDTQTQHPRLSVEIPQDHPAPSVNQQEGAYDNSLMGGSSASTPEPFAFRDVANSGSGDIGDMVNSARPSQATISLNLVGVEAGEAIKQILGQVLEETYVMEYEPRGPITLQTARKVDEETAIELLNIALSSVGAAISQRGDYFVVQRQADRGVTADVEFLQAGGISVGDKTRVIPLNYVDAASIEALFKSFPDQSINVSSDASRNLLILNSDTVPLDDLAQIASVFDRNWLKSMSFSATPVKFTDPEDIVSDLNAIFAQEEGMANQNMLRFLPIPRLKAIVTITKNPDYLDLAETWISRLDREHGQGASRFFVIPIQHREATEIATLLSTAFEDMFDAPSGITQTSDTLEPGSTAAFAETAPPTADAMTGARTSGAMAGSMPASKIRISADTTNNSIIIYALPDQLGLIEDIVERLDTAPDQIYLETTIAEVTLNNDLAYGLTWFFQNGDLSTGFSDIPTGAVSNRFPGFSALISGADARVALSAVSSITDVKVLSSPSIMVLDNKTATLQVGDQVPIVTQSSVSVGNSDAPIVNSVSLRDTGIILNVTPRVNEEGKVSLEIEQEVSNVVPTVSSGIDSPTIQQRRINTSVAVDSGKSIALGGLIRERVSDNTAKIPFLGSIPFLGKALFQTTNDVKERTELLVLITPRVVRSQTDSETIIQDLARDMSHIEALYSMDRPSLDNVSAMSMEAAEDSRS
ncbi:MAG: type II secretion system secretin GspD [Henriciella sp.]